jgi:hypothetical protein
MPLLTNVPTPKCRDISFSDVGQRPSHFIFVSVPRYGSATGPWIFRNRRGGVFGGVGGGFKRINCRRRPYRFVPVSLPVRPLDDESTTVRPLLLLP